MKKSKFLLLGSVASLASIPFVAAKCGDTKEEEKKPAEIPGGGQKAPETPAEGNQNPGTENGGNSNDNSSASTEKKSLAALISNNNQQLGKIKANDENSILDALLAKNKSLNLDKSQLDVKKIKDASAIVFAKDKSTKYDGQILVSFTIDKPGSSGNGGSTMSRVTINFTNTPPNPLLTSVESEILENLRLGKTVEESNRLITENSNAINSGANWKGVTDEEKEKAKESGDFWERYWKVNQ
ncbi:variable surface lipoprotein [Mycoplasmopsis agalactiae]|uniref:variable surface lipoprotein n=1 Tax=Mycoplasmopsis agalactiae TaxID=2110 RepID=UPI00211C68A2|nr:variable surface lipoprotein [Mycoplasmopsis agalactiae]UUM25495.1 variable surface lipoprotein [Mycoplasmopsis agalactiae]